MATPEPVPAARDNTGILALVVGGLLFLALAIWGFIAIGRRKPAQRLAVEDATPVTPAAPAAVAAPQRRDEHTDTVYRTAFPQRAAAVGRFHRR